VVFDQLRKKRNGLKYYGENADIEETKSALEFASKTMPKLKKITEQTKQ